MQNEMDAVNNTQGTNQAAFLAEGRAISDMAKDDDQRDEVAYVDDNVTLPETRANRTEGEKQADVRPEDFEPFHLEAVEENKDHPAT